MILVFSLGFLKITFVDIIDIALVSFLLYNLYKLLKGSVAIRIFLGFLSLYLLYLVVESAQMKLMGFILDEFMTVGAVALIIIFHQEIRKFLLLLGKTTVLNKDNFLETFKIWKRSAKKRDMNITPVIEACKSLGGTNTGALIVFSKNTELKFYAESGDPIDCMISKRIILAIFNKQSPLHDGAVIIYKNRIKAARCILPVTERVDLPAQFGLRHRAAVGMSETTDTLVLVISEETGEMSVARNGLLMHNLSAQEIRKKINDYLLGEDEFIEDLVAETQTTTEATTEVFNKKGKDALKPSSS